jgi:site-specific DNA-methyltransferase (adenine-specific)
LETKTETKRKKEGMEFLNKIILSDCLTGIKQMPDSSVDCCISSPPYWGLRDYGVDGQVGNEQDFKEFVKKLIELYSEIQRVLKPTGTCFVNLGDTYNGTKQGNTETNKNPKLVTDSFKKERIKDIQDKSLLMIPERFAIGMIDEGWILRNQIIWHKPNQMPQSATDRFTVDFEKIFFFVKQSTGYYFEQQFDPYTEPLDRWAGQMIRGNYKTKTDQFAIQERNGRDMRPNPEGKNMRTVWSINTEPFPEAHFATYPEKLVKRMIEAGCPENGLVLDPFMGAGTTAVVAKKLNRNYTGFELNPKYKLIAENRLIKEVGLFL